MLIDFVACFVDLAAGTSTPVDECRTRRSLATVTSP